jgi:heme exporter protein A
MAAAESLTVEAENLTAARGLRVLFEGVSLKLQPGEALELRGPNGSGKSTLLRILAGLTRPMAGEVRMMRNGEDALRHYLGHLDAIKPTETALEQARFWAAFFGRPRDTAPAALERMGLTSRAEVPGRGLSAGQKRRLALTRLLIDPRPIWLLDEPTASLDVQGRKLMQDLVADHRASGGVVIAAIHGEGFANARELDISAMRPKARAS